MTIANLLSFVKLADEYYIICNRRIDNAIYVQSKDDSKYLQFQRDHKHNLYYMYISETELDKHCYLITVKDGKTTFSILDQKRAGSSENPPRKMWLPFRRRLHKRFGM